MRLTMKELAELAGVSQAAVSLVLNGNAAGRVRAEKQQCILNTAKKYGFIPNAAARNLRNGEHRQVGILMHASQDSGASRFLSLIQRKFSIRNYIGLFSFWSSYDDVDAAYESVLRHGVEGIVAWENPSLDRYDFIPTVTYHGDLKKLDDVRSDDLFVVEASLKHLCGLGHRRIGIISASTDCKRMLFKQRFQDYGCHFHPDWFLETCQFQADQIVEKIKNMRERPTAWFVNNDMLAMMLEYHLLAAGIRIPEDISLIGFNDVPETVAALRPLTTFHLNFEAIAEALVSKLIERMGDPGKAPEKIVIRPEFIIRGSTGVAPDGRGSENRK